MVEFAHDPASAEVLKHTPATASGPPRVSVITIFLNASGFIGQAIESVLAQTLPDWELILVDDGSSDASTELTRDWCQRLPGRIRYFEHPLHANQGMSASRNLGLAKARGEYIAFLDADDVYMPDRLEQHVRILDAMPWVDLVQSEQMYWYCWRDILGKPEQEICLRPPLYVGDCVLNRPQALLMLLSTPDIFTAPCSFTVRRSVALELGGFEAEFRSLYEDQVFLTKVYAQKTVYALQAWLAKYRIHAEGSLTIAARTAHLPDGIFQLETRHLCDWQMQYLTELGVVDNKIRELLAVRRHRAMDPRSTRLRSLSALVRQTVHRAARRLLPLPAYRRLLQYRQNWSAEHARRDYQALCRVQAEEILRRRLSLSSEITDAPPPSA